MGQFEGRNFDPQRGGFFRVTEFVTSLGNPPEIFLPENVNRYAFFVSPEDVEITIGLTPMGTGRLPIWIDANTTFSIQDRDFPTMPGLNWYAHDQFFGVNVYVQELIWTNKDIEPCVGKTCKLDEQVKDSKPILKSGQLQRESRRLRRLERSLSSRFLSQTPVGFRAGNPLL
jgi:hypothetical protein